MRNALYFLYYLKNTSKNKLKKFLNKAIEDTQKSKAVVLKDIVFASFKHKTSILDYFYFRFYNKNEDERSNWAGTGFMYEYQLKMNPKNKRNILEDKKIFLNTYSDYVKRSWCGLDKFDEEKKKVLSILHNISGKTVVKNSKGQVGREVKVLAASDFTFDSLKSYMLGNNFDLLEESVIQHSELMKLSPSGLNTVRIITQLNDKHEVIILGARLRVSVNSSVDNLGAGNFAVAIDEKNGVVTSNGIYSDITKKNVSFHPVTKVKLKGFQIPHWRLAIDTVKEAAIKFPQNKSIGWDVAITDNQIDLIEGNHNWCKLLYQLPVNRGLKKELLKYYK